VRHLLTAAGKSTMSSHMCNSVGAGTGTAAGGRIYGLTRCAAGISCADCRRCLRGALAVVDREYNGSAGMQVLRLSCLARYERYPFYSTKSLHRRLLVLSGADGLVISSGGRIIAANRTASTPASTPAVPAPPSGRNSPPAQAQAPPPAASRTIIPNATVNSPRSAQPTPAPPGGHTPQPAAAEPNNGKEIVISYSMHPCLRRSPIVSTSACYCS
jgi:hypothetical protein